MSQKTLALLETQQKSQLRWMPNWNAVLEEHRRLILEAQAQAQRSFDTIRRKYIAQLHTSTGRNTIAYYSGYLQKPRTASDINDEDKNGFMNAIHGMDRTRGLDLILHTPGGSVHATLSIVDYLHQMFGNDIRAIVPQIAMSAGTMIACSCRRIVMGLHSNLGPIDPHLRGLPAYGVIKEFRRAIREVTDDPATIPVWQSIISQYRPTFLSQCENAIKLSNEFVRQQLEGVMFNGQADARRKARAIVRRLTDYSGNKSHERHIHVDECEEMGLQIDRLETDNAFQDAVLTVHHSFMLTLANSRASKIIENHSGAAIIKQVPEQKQQGN